MAKVEAMLRAAEPHRGILATQLDADPLLFNVANGTLEFGAEPDIRLRPHRREDLITHLSPAMFDPEAGCPRFRAFLDRVQPDPANQRFLQTWAGYCLSGLADEQVMLIHYGLGANGKSTFLGTLAYVMGTYAATVPIETFVEHRFGRGAGDATPDIARLPGKRLVIASEPERQARIAESLIKVATGGGNMTARHLYQRQFEFKPVFKLNIDANTRPTVRGQDEGIWRRVILLNWSVIIPPEERDRGLPLMFRQEASGILNWSLDGWRLYKESGLYLPDTIIEAIQDYRTDSDPVRQFVAARLRKSQSTRVSASRVLAAYQEWCRENALEPISGNAFGRRLTEVGIRREVMHITYYVDWDLVDTKKDGESNVE